MLLDNKVALVTGSSKGIGRSTALMLAESGADVVVHYHTDEEGAVDVMEKIGDTGQKAAVVKADMTSPEYAKRLITTTVEKMGRIDILVNNAGAFVTKGLVDTSVEEWNEMINVNLTSAFYGCKYACEYMRVQQYGRIVNVGFSLSEHLSPAPTIAAFAIEEAANGILTNLVSPGIIDTWQAGEEKKMKWAKAIPVNKLGLPSNVAQAILFLLSDDNNYLNGANITVSGGWNE